MPEHQEARLTVLPGEDMELPCRAVPPLDEELAHPAVLVVPVPDSDSGPPLQGVSGVEGPAENPAGGGVEGAWEVDSQWKILGFLADGRCSQAVLDFLSAIDVGRRVPAGEGTESGASEWELQKRRERGGGGGGGAEELGATGELGAGGELHLLLPAPSFTASVDGLWRQAALSFVSFFCLSRSLGFSSFVIYLVHTSSSWDRSGRRAKGSLQRACAATARTADGKPDKMYDAIV